METVACEGVSFPFAAQMVLLARRTSLLPWGIQI
jgi:hypothetical protein